MGRNNKAQGVKLRAIDREGSREKVEEKGEVWRDKLGTCKRCHKLSCVERNSEIQMLK